MSFGPHDYLAHILDECEFLCRSSAGMSIDAFLADPILRRACQRSLEIIGEAAKKVDDVFKATHPGLPWRDMAAMRDRLIHGYFGVDDAIVWDVMQEHIPPLQAAIRQLLARG
jgi:uncharacterized protein with HEPN domain